MDYSTPIMFVPLGVPTTSRPQVVASKKPIPPKPTVHIKPPVEKKIVAPEIKKPTTIAAAAPKKIEEKKQPTAEPKKVTPPASTVDVKKIEEVKKELPKVEPPKKPEPVAQKPQPVTPAPAQKEIAQPSIAQALDIEQTIVPVVPENAHISHNYREVEALRRGAQLQKELVQKWKPPIGVSPECMCEISFCVNISGGIENLKMVKNSGVMMYDISARQALFAMKMPQWTHGKPLIISFKQ